MALPLGAAPIAFAAAAETGLTDTFDAAMLEIAILSPLVLRPLGRLVTFTRCTCAGPLIEVYFVV